MEKEIVNMEAKLSEHFTLGEMIKTNAKGLDNTPSHGAVMNLKNLCENWLEDLRYSYNALYGDGDEPIIINSGFRSEAVNKAVGGVPGSNHLTGCAVDIKCFGIEQSIRYASILLDIADGKKQEFDELLIERSPKGSYWLHFAVRPKDNRRKIRFVQT
jgi:uncharacterized protein YcbK (DUF882 family)